MALVKICGLRNESDIDAAIEAGADRLGLVVVPTSPRAIAVALAARFARRIAGAGREAWLVASLAATPSRQGLAALIDETPEITAVQLHGQETPDEIAAFQEECPGVRIVKALGVSSAADLERSRTFLAADALLLDAKPPKGANREGGFGEPFDWTLLKGFSPGKPWVLSGGLKPDTVADAIHISGAKSVDVSSGVESAPGVKDKVLVQAFIDAAKSA